MSNCLGGRLLLIATTAFWVVTLGSFRCYGADRPADADTSSEAQGGTLSEILVTAQRRTQPLQDVPIPVAVIDGRSVERDGLVDSSTIATEVPGLDFSRQASSGGTPFLRGVGTSSVTVGAENSVATYVDDVYISAPAANIFALDNIERIEVLEGPQGTLFGRNATGGVVNIITKSPTFTPSADLSVGYGNFDTSSFGLYGTSGLSSNVAANLAIQYSNQGIGWGHALENGQSIFRDSGDYNVRSKLLWNVLDSTTFLISGDFARDNSDIGANFAPLPGTYAPTGLPSPGRFNSWGSGRDFNLLHQGGVSGKLESDFGPATFVSITAWRRTYQSAFLNQASVPTPIVDIPYFPWTREFSQEFHLRSAKGSALTWILGTYYLQNIGSYDPLGVEGAAIAPLPPGAIAQTFARQTVNSYSGFAQASYAILPNTNLTAGIRYTRDNYSIEGVQRIDFPDGTSGAPFAPGQQWSSFSKPTFLGSLDHKLTDDVLIYASYSRGFKSGGYNILSYTSPPVSPEVLDAAQLGLKSEWFNHTLRFNSSLFDYDYKNLQVQFIGTGASYSINAGRARIKGGDAQLTVAPTKDFSISAAVAALDGEYTEFPAGFTYTANPPAIGGNTQILNQDLSGNATARTPKRTANVSVDYALPLEQGKVDMNAIYYYNSGFFWDPGNQLRQPSYALLHAALGWKPESGRWDADLWGSNLLNKYYYTFATLSTFGDQISPAQPRTYGITLRAHFR